IFLQAAAPVGDYAIIDYRYHHGRLPLGGAAVAVLSSWPLWLVCIAILVWVFPDGRLPGGRWRPVVPRPGTRSASTPAGTWSATRAG
ncbi:MAG TPA: hypothetical protein VIX86_10840, partial [Streptosporangiaceae bacterium]